MRGGDSFYKAHSAMEGLYDACLGLQDPKQSINC